MHDNVTAVGFEAGCIMNVGDKIRFIIYNKLEINYDKLEIIINDLLCIKLLKKRV